MTTQDESLELLRKALQNMEWKEESRDSLLAMFHFASNPGGPAFQLPGVRLEPAPVVVGEKDFAKVGAVHALQSPLTVSKSAAAVDAEERHEGVEEISAAGGARVSAALSMDEHCSSVKFDNFVDDGDAADDHAISNDADRVQPFSLDPDYDYDADLIGKNPDKYAVYRDE